MNLNSLQLLKKLFQTVLADGELETDVTTTGEYAALLSDSDRSNIASEIRSCIESDSIALDEIGTEANRWFGSEEEAREWLQSLLSAIDQASASADAITVLDSNGTPLLEGDSVTVIKDLKVKGGSSDLKRGTLVRKIHLTSDPGLIECKVDGSVLVLKTEFLKKS
jgi:protein PhnA